MVKKTMRSSDGKYHVHGKVYDALVGSRAQVGHNSAYKTSGGLTKSDLFKNKHDRYVSLKKHRTAKKEKRLEKAGYFTKKGTFGSIKKNVSKKRSTRKRK
jgi:hypothetical protein